MIGVIYARYSEGPKQTDQSIEGQVNDCMAFAQRNGIDVIEVYADRHISGKSVVGRYEFQRMLQDAQLHKFDCVIVWKIDRFGRDRQDIAVSKMQLKKAGVKLMYAEESVPEGPEGIILESVLEGIAEYYSADLRQKVIRGRRETLKKGLFCGGSLPIGYMVDSERHIVPDPATAPHVREVFRMYAAGSQIKDCVWYLQDKKVKGQRGPDMSKSTVGAMLRNKRYLGIFDVSGVELRAEPLIDEETFLLCADRFPGGPQKNAAGKADVDYLLSCKIYCGKCGRMLTGESGKGRSRVYYYYKCPAKKRNAECDLAPVKKEWMEELVLKATVEDMLTEDTISMLTDEILRVQDRDLADDPVKVIQSALDSCRKKQANILHAIEETGARGLATRLAKLEEEEAELSLELKKAQVCRPRLSREDISLWLHSFRNGDLSDDDFKKRLLETFVARVELLTDRAVIFYHISEKSKQKRTVSFGSDTARLLEESGLYPNHPTYFCGYIILVVMRAA